jgi:L-aspartate semialdehyde sulfurtransferase ferredoxin
VPVSPDYPAFPAPEKAEKPDYRESALAYTLAPMARRRLKLIFGPSLVKEPVIYQLGRNFEIVTNIRRADVTKDHGWVLLEVSGEPDELDRGVEFLESRGVKVEPAEGDLVE